MDVSNGLPLHPEIKQETSFEVAFTSGGSFPKTRPQIEFTNKNTGLNNINHINNENHEEMVDNKETTLKTIQKMQDFVDDVNDILQVPTDQIPQTSSQANSTIKVKRFLPAQWPQAATRLLIELYKKHKNLFESPIINKKDSWKRISSLLASKGYPYPATVCDNKFRALKYRYNLLKESNGKATTGRRKWEFFQLMEELMTDSPIQTTKSLYRSSVNCKKPTPLIKKTLPQLSSRSGMMKIRNQNILALKSATTLGNHVFPSGRNIRTVSMHQPSEKSVTPNSSSIITERNQDALHVFPKTNYLPKNGLLSSTFPQKSEQSSKKYSNEASCRISPDPSVENPTPNGPPSWFVKFQEESLKRLAQIEQLEQRKITAYEHRNILIDQRTNVLADISRSLERVADSVQKNTNGSNTTRKDLLMTFSELLKRIEDT